MTELGRQWSKVGWFWRQAIGLTLLLGVAFIIAMACYAAYAGVTGAFPVEQREPPFYEILSLVLALAAIGITAFGVGAYRLLSAAIERKVNERVEIARVKALVVQAIDDGWLYWNLYLLSEGKPQPARSQLLESAIIETQKGYDFIHQHLDTKEHEVRKFLAIIKNNWAFYIYEKARLSFKISRSEKALALGFIDDLEKEIALFPDLTTDFIDTIEKVAGRFRPATS